MTQTNPSNVTPITDKQPAPPAKFIVAAVLEGFPVQVEVEGKASDLRALVDRLKAIGAEPPVQTPAQASTQAKAAPLCPVHNTTMAPSTKRPGTYYCKSSVGQAEDGRTLYCTKKA